MFEIKPEFIWLGAIGLYALATVTVFAFKDVDTQVERIPWKQYLSDSIGVVKGLHTLIYIVTNACAVAPFLLWQVKFDMVSLGFVFVGFFVMNVTSVVVAGLFHERIGNDYRATSESLVSMADSLIVAVVAPITMVIGDRWGVEWAITCSIVLYGICVLLVAVGPMRTSHRRSVIVEES